MDGSSRYPLSGWTGAPIDLAAIEAAYSDATFGTEEPNLAAMSPRAAVHLYRKFNPDTSKDLSDQQVYDQFIVECKNGNVWIDEDGLVWIGES